MNMQAIQKAAQELNQSLLLVPKGDKEIYVYADDGPAWGYAAIKESHGSELPNDWVYEKCAEVADALNDAAQDEQSYEDWESESYDIPDALTDSDVFSLLIWLRGDYRRVDWLEDAVELGATTGINILQMAQYAQIQHIVESLKSAIEQHAE